MVGLCLLQYMLTVFNLPPKPMITLCRSVKSLLTVVSLAVILGYQGDQTDASNGNGIPCLYEGKLRTEKSWHGYLANITVITTGSMQYEFSYPADKCCQNILFYTEDQMSIISARMNCWQKEYLLRPEEDQILRLTPRFAWSGCRMTHPNSIATYVCAGGRSFTPLTMENEPTTWHVAVSNCAALQGLELKYKLEVYGHIGDCPHHLTTTIPTTTQTVPTPKITLIPKESVATQIADNRNVCVLEGVLNVTNNWYGFVANISLTMGGGFRFKLSYPYEMQVENVILYNEDDVDKLEHKQSCWQKEGIIRTRNVPDQILDLTFRSSWNGCISKNGTSGRTLTCIGERRYELSRRVFMAVSNCRGINGLYLNYRLEVYGFDGDLCNSGDASSVHSAFTLLPTRRTFSCANLLCFLLTVTVSCWLYCDSAVMLLERVLIIQPSSSHHCQIHPLHDPCKDPLHDPSVPQIMQGSLLPANSVILNTASSDR